MTQATEVAWAYGAGGGVLALGLACRLSRGSWREEDRLGRLMLLAPVLYAAPLAGFATEHFTATAAIAGLVPAWLPGHVAWAYGIGACFFAAALSLATEVRAGLAASLLALTFLLFVALMDGPGWLADPHNETTLTLALRELTFGGGALALAAGLGAWGRFGRGAATLARRLLAVVALFYSFEQFRHGARVPGVPLARLTPTWIPGHAAWTYLAAAAYAACGLALVLDRKARAAATALGLTVLLVVAAVYAPMAVADRASLDNGFNYLADTLMFAGAVLLIAAAIPAERRPGS